MKKIFETIIFFFIDLLALKNNNEEEKLAKKETLDEVNKKYIETRGL